MIANLTEVLVYAAALDVYRRMNRREVRLTDRQVHATLDLVEWTKRPSFLTKEA